MNWVFNRPNTCDLGRMSRLIMFLLTQSTQVSSGSNKPYYQKSLGLADGTFIRLGRSTVKADADIIEELKWQSRDISYDQLPLYHTSAEDLDGTKAQYFLDHRRNGITSPLNEDTLRSYEIIKKEHMAAKIQVHVNYP